VLSCPRRVASGFELVRFQRRISPSEPPEAKSALIEEVEEFQLLLFVLMSLLMMMALDGYRFASIDEE
jgi:hypothetical protein